MTSPKTIYVDFDQDGEPCATLRPVGQGDIEYLSPEATEEAMRDAWNHSSQILRPPVDVWAGSIESYRQFEKELEDKAFTAFLTSRREK